MPQKVGYARRERTLTVRSVPATVVNALAAEAQAEQRSLAAHIRVILGRYVRGQKEQVGVE